MLTRRTFLTAAALAPLLSACGQPNNPQIRLLQSSIPAQILKEFQRQSKKNDLTFLPSEQLADLYTLLETWQNPKKASGWQLPNTPLNRPAPVADLITLGDAWLAPAIQQGLIQPLEWEVQWKWLVPEWRAFAKRNAQGQLDPNGKIWGAPYRWGTLMLAYHTEKFKSLGWKPQEWSDLWRPELKGHISLLDSPRVTIALALKKMGQSANLTDLSQAPNLSAELQALHQQVKFYSSDAYLQPLSLEDTWVAVGWSNEILPTIKRDRALAAAVPASGTLLTADLWVRPTRSNPSGVQTARLMDWISFCWQPNIATQLSNLSLVASPFFKGSSQPIPPILQDKPLLLPPAATLQRSEFLNPLPPAAIDQYRRQWLAMRQ
jgi:putative spermidine/putrescine transport system substrate-binding protein